MLDVKAVLACAGNVKVKIIMTLKEEAAYGQVNGNVHALQLQHVIHLLPLGPSLKFGYLGFNLKGLNVNPSIQDNFIMMQHNANPHPANSTETLNIK